MYLYLVCSVASSEQRHERGVQVRSRSARRKARSVLSHDHMNSLGDLNPDEEVQSDNHILKNYESARK